MNIQDNQNNNKNTISKATYNFSNLFSLKHYNDNNLNCQSYKYPTIYGIRCAIIGSIIQVDGIEKAKELFYKVKNAIIYIQYPYEYKLNNIKLKRYRNSYYKMKDGDELDRDKLLEPKISFHTSMGFRQHYHLPQITFYIDNSIPNLELYLKNIDWLGTAESLVYLDKIEQVSNMENVLCKWDSENDTELHEQHDFCPKTTFETIYMYSDEYKHIHDSFMCEVKDIEL